MNCRVALLIGIVWPICYCVADNLPPPWSIQELRFSPDGRYILAAGKSEITVLTSQPLEILFRIPGENPSLVNFTPDSRAIVLKTSGKSLEHWNVKDRARTDSTQIPPLDCGTEKLSPDGRSWACLDSKGTLRLFEVSSWKPILVKKRFGKLSIASSNTRDFRYREFPGRYIGSLGSGEIDFSPDGRFVVMSTDASPAIAWDLKEGHRVKLRRALWSLKWPNSYTKDLVFIGPIG